MPKPEPEPEPRASSLAVAHINTNLRWGGGERQILALLRGSAGHGVRSILIARPDGELYRRAREEAPQCEIIPFEFRSPYSPLALMRMRRVLQQLRPSLLHLHDSAGAHLGVGVARRLGGLPVVLHRRISSPVRSNPVSRALYRSPCIHTYIAVSESARGSLLGASVPRDRTVVIPSGVNVDQLQPTADRVRLRAQLGLAAGTWLGTVSSLEKKKDVETFIRAAAQLATEDPALRFLVVGSGPEERRLRQLARRLGLTDRYLRFTGEVPDAHRFTAALDLFVFPSLREGSPGVIKEAMALGVPIVAAAAPGTIEVVSADTARLVPPGSAGDCQRAIRELLADPDRRRAMVVKARTRVECLFPIELTVARIVACYRRILSPESESESESATATVAPPGRAAASRFA